MLILVLNVGSSTYKSSLYKIKDEQNKTPSLLWEGGIDWNTQKSAATIKIKLFDSFSKNISVNFYKDRKEVAHLLLQTIDDYAAVLGISKKEINCVGHRVVHGGKHFLNPTLITPKVKDTIRDLFSFAPLHNPVNLEGIEIFQEIFPNIPHIAVFDTAFHHTIPEHLFTYPIPLKYRESGLRRYGFHGISHANCASFIQKVSRTTGKKYAKVISCHLGNGSSLTALQNGKSIYTTMGFTPLEGLIMGTRSGSIDPGLILHLLENEKLSSKEVSHLLNKESGLKGICNESDMRKILERRSLGDPSAHQAFEMLCYSIQYHIGALAAHLQGLDAIIFTGGIGENCIELRKKVCENFSYLDLILDAKKNEKNQSQVNLALPSSKVDIYMIEAEENKLIAEACISSLLK